MTKALDRISFTVGQGEFIAIMGASWTCWHCWEVISVTYIELSLRNARRQARDYLVYFATIVMTAALIYAFNGLVFSGELLELSKRLKSLPVP